MSLWNRIGDVASTVSKTATSPVINLAKWGGEVASGAGSAVRFAWDVGTAPWNDAEEYNGFVQTLKTASQTEGKDIIKPLASAGGAIMKVPGLQPALERINKINQEYIREPLTTFELVQGDVIKSDSLKTFFDPNTWQQAYKGAQEISYGQAAMSKYRSIYDPKFNVYDPAQREKAFKDSAWGKFA